MIGNDWDLILEEEYKKKYFINLLKTLKEAYHQKKIFPEEENIFKALKLCSFSDTKVIILGQDPYHSINQAHGLAFSVPEGQILPPSLKNIYKEIHSDLGIAMSNNGNLVRWAKQGVLLLNTVLTVEAGRPNSHKNIGWETFTNAIIEKLNQKKNKLIFVLWGNDAKKKASLINNHHILTATHPSPLSAYRGFLGCKHFSKINNLLVEDGLKSIDWKI